MFSIFSTIDCRFVRVDVGFKPDNCIYRSEEFGLGLWSMEDPTAPEIFFMVDSSRRVGSITRGDHYYSSFLCEGIKSGLFLNIKPCTSEMWEQNNTIGSSNMVVERYEADQCELGRSTYVSLCAFACYLFVLIYLTAALVKPELVVLE